jgi:hypothetical protein
MDWIVNIDVGTGVGSVAQCPMDSECPDRVSDPSRREHDMSISEVHYAVCGLSLISGLDKGFRCISSK